MKATITQIAITLLLSTTMLAAMEQTSEQEIATAMLFEGIHCGNLEKVQVALKLNADVNKEDDEQGTPLILSTRCAHFSEELFEIFKIVLANKNIKIDYPPDRPALYYAVNTVNTSYVLDSTTQRAKKKLQMILAAGANPFIKIKNGKTVFEVGNEETKEIIRNFMAQKEEETKKNK